MPTRILKISDNTVRLCETKQEPVIYACLSHCVNRSLSWPIDVLINDVNSVGNRFEALHTYESYDQVPAS